MKRYRVVFTADARRDYRREVRKWRRGHPKNTYQLEDEVARAIKVLNATPRYGEESADPGLPDVRRVVLQKSEFLLYYFVSDELRRVELLPALVCAARRQAQAVRHPLTLTPRWRGALALR